MTKPIVPGLLPVLSAKQVRRITALCGAKIPPELQAHLETAGDDDGHAEEVGIRQCVAQATELLRRGVPGIHYYVLNKSSHMRRDHGGVRPYSRRCDNPLTSGGFCHDWDSPDHS